MGHSSFRERIFASRATLVLCLSLYASLAQAASGLRMEQPWARASLSGVGNAIVYGTLVNDGPATLSIVGGSTPVATRVEFHIHAMNGDVMTMRQLDAIDLKAGERATLQPGGLHIMLINLKQTLKRGESFPLTLRTRDGTALTIDVTVTSPTATGP